MRHEITHLKQNNAKYARLALCFEQVLTMWQSLCMRNFLLLVCVCSATIRVCRVHWHKSFRISLTFGQGVNLPWPLFYSHEKSSKWQPKLF